MKKLLLFLSLILLLSSYSLSEQHKKDLLQFMHNHPSKLLTTFYNYLFPNPLFVNNKMSDKDFQAHITMAPDGLNSIRKGWIPYFHRHQRYEQVNEVIHFLLKNDTLTTDDLHFFAMILAKHPEQLNTLQHDAEPLSATQKSLTEQLIHQAKSFTQADISQPAELGKIWAEYAVTGDMQLVADAIKLLDPTQYPFEYQITSSIEQTLTKQCLNYFPVYQKLSDELLIASGAYENRLKKITNNLADQFYDKSDRSWYLADNFRKNKEYKSALATLREGLFFTPDSPYLYRLTGEILLQQKKPAEALASFNYARPISPDKLLSGILYYVGLIYNERNQRDKVLETYLEALRLDPDNTNNLTNVAWAYDRLGDTRNADIYYRKMLQHNPAHSLIEYALDFFKDHHLIPPKIKENLEFWLMEKQYDKLETVFDAAQRQREKDENGKLKIYTMFDQIMPPSSSAAPTFIPYVKAYDQWVAARPESFLANACYGMLYVNYAWNARGCGYSYTVSRTGWDLFHKRLKIAKKYLEKAYNIAPNKIGTAVDLITISSVLPNTPDDEAEKWFTIAVTIEPSDPAPYLQKSHFMDPAWGGSRAAAFAFARHTFKTAPKDSMAPVILAKTHWSVYDDDKSGNYFKTPEVWAEMKALQTELIRRFPNSAERHNWFALSACYADDLDTARQELSTIGDNWLKNIWGEHTHYEKCKKRAFKEALTK